MKRPLAASDIIEAKCTRCKAVYNHTIVAMVGKVVVRVQCNTCGGAHNYHAPKEEKAATSRVARTPSPGGAGRAKKDPAASARAQWQEIAQAKDMTAGISYDINRKYRLNDLVQHPTFGPGIVMAVKGNKMDILFQDGVKLLR